MEHRLGRRDDYHEVRLDERPVHARFGAVFDGEWRESRVCGVVDEHAASEVARLRRGQEMLEIALPEPP